MRRRVPRLPDAYQEVEYIESSGTQYIDTGWTPSSNYARVVAQIEPTLSGQQWEVFYGMTNGSNHYSLHTNKDKWYINVGSNVNIITDIAFSSGTKVNTEFEANNGAYSVNVNSTTYSGTYSGTVVQSTRNMYIFAYNENGSITWKPSMKLYSFKVYSATSTLVRDFVPCYRKSDNVIGLYDLVNDQFYTNAGSGAFTKGADSSTLVYKEFQVRPTTQEYSYSFVDAGSVSQMQTDGWSFYRQSGTATSGWGFTSNGLHNTNTGSSNKFAQLCGPEVLDCTNASKITIQVEHYLTSGSWNGGSHYGIEYGQTSYGTGTFGGGGNINSMNNSGYNGYACSSSSQSNWNRTSLATGNYTGITIIDLINKTIKTSLTGKTDLTLTLSDTDVTTIRQAKGVVIGYDNVGNYYKSIKVTIER